MSKLKYFLEKIELLNQANSEDKFRFFTQIPIFSLLFSCLEVLHCATKSLSRLNQSVAINFKDAYDLRKMVRRLEMHQSIWQRAIENRSANHKSALMICDEPVSQTSCASPAAIDVGWLIAAVAMAMRPV